MNRKQSLKTGWGVRMHAHACVCAIVFWCAQREWQWQWVFLQACFDSEHADIKILLRHPMCWNQKLLWHDWQCISGWIEVAQRHYSFSCAYPRAVCAEIKSCSDMMVHVDQSDDDLVDGNAGFSHARFDSVCANVSILLDFLHDLFKVGKNWVAATWRILSSFSRCWDRYLWNLLDGCISHAQKCTAHNPGQSYRGSSISFMRASAML